MRRYGFEGEVKHKYSEQLFHFFSEVFNWLPLGAVIGGKVFVVHGGLFSRDDVTLAELRKVQRNREPPEEGLMSEMLWSDPQPANGRSPSKRGVGLSFGPDVTKAFLQRNNLELVVRSHEVKVRGARARTRSAHAPTPGGRRADRRRAVRRAARRCARYAACARAPAPRAHHPAPSCLPPRRAPQDAGYEVEADGQLITVFSAPNYCDQMGNKGALLRFDSSMRWTPVQFDAVPHPPIRPMQYASMGALFGF